MVVIGALDLLGQISRKMEVSWTTGQFILHKEISCFPASGLDPWPRRRCKRQK